MFMIMFVLDNPDQLNQVLQSWLEYGISGATIVESTGAYRQLVKHVPMRYAYGENMVQETGNITLFAIVENEKIVQDCLAAVEKVVGNLDDASTGIFTAWPLIVVKGLSHPNTKEK